MSAILRRATGVASGFGLSAIRSRFGKATEHRRAKRKMLAAAGRPDRIVVGPWTSEIGFELLYWIPTLRWLLRTQGVEPERVVAISRGGVESWYTDLARSYVDVLDYFHPEELREWTDARVQASNTQKQRHILDVDREILARAHAELGERYSLVHPSLMYKMYRTFWLWRTSRRPLARVLDHTKFAPLQAKPIDEDLRLPSRYVAIKAYFRQSLPDTDANRAFWNSLVSTLAESTSVVILSTEASIDEHRDCALPTSERVLNLAEYVEPRNNLDVQTSVVAGAEALFTTYGGFAYLGSMLNVPTYAFHSEDGDDLNPQHVEVMLHAQKALHEEGHGAGLTFTSVDDFKLMASLTNTRGQVSAS